jgi:hypothetical protein
MVGATDLGGEVGPALSLLQRPATPTPVGGTAVPKPHSGKLDIHAKLKAAVASYSSLRTEAKRLVQEEGVSPNEVLIIFNLGVDFC